MFSTQNFLGFVFLMISCFAHSHEQSPDMIIKSRIFSGKVGFIKQKAIFLEIRSDSAFVYVFDGQSNYTLKEFYDTISLEKDKVIYETENCILTLEGSRYEILLKANDKKVKLKPELRVELYNYINDSWINEQREIFFNLSKQNPKSYTLYDETVKNSKILDLMEKDPKIFLKAFNAAFKDIKPLEAEYNEDDEY